MTKESVDQLIEELNATYAVVDEGGKVHVIRETEDHVLKRRTIQRMSFADFRKFFQNRKVTRGKGNDVSVVDLGDFWLNHSARRQYSRVVFKPEGASSDEFNLWRGFTVEPQPGDWSRMADHWQDVICGGVESRWRWMKGWLARMVQHPGTQGEVAVAIRGRRGVGKGLPVRAVGSLLGQHFIHIANPRHLTGTFNAHFEDAVMVFADEAVASKAGESMLKMLITEPIIPVERKYIDLAFVKNCCHLILASNDDWIIPAGMDERRYFVMDAHDEFVGNRKYFAGLINEMEQGGRAAMLYDLLHFDFHDLDLRTPPDTEGLREQKLLSMKAHERWWFDKLMNGCQLSDYSQWQTEVLCDDLLEDYANHLKRSKDTSTATELGMLLQKLVQGLQRTRRQFPGAVGRRYHWVFPSLAECRAHFNRITKSHHPWPTDDQS